MTGKLNMLLIKKINPNLDNVSYTIKNDKTVMSSVKAKGIT